MSRRLRGDLLERTLRSNPQQVKTGPRLVTSILLMICSAQALGSEALKLVYELHGSDGGTHVIAIFADGAAYHAHVPQESPQPDGCTEHRKASLWWLSSYDYAKVRTGEPAIRLDPGEVGRHWRTIVDGPIDYAREARLVHHSALSCAFAVVATPAKQPVELRLIQYSSLFLLVTPQSPAQRAVVDWLGMSLGDLTRKITADDLQPRLHQPVPERR